ncbi:acyl-CoA-binding domain-containing protein 4 [Oryzias melastigma]|uniref:Acyl-CoA binding domain containing 4 n=1 Tax=Oryzias melastigma TaxID=30732 RepID=A0A3B3DH93_ORYME|nr:acyl-CoA-binding domain-containing protein 4 [Oryzias melastigma]
MPALTMAEPAVDHHKRFQTAVDVIHNLPKNGSYRPSYEVMLRFYSLYKQAVCGPCQVPRPAFWDPVGRYKWDAWSRLGEMSRDAAMAAYVEEMKKVAQEVIDTMPMNETTASLFHHFEPLYRVIDDMPRPPGSLFSVRAGPDGSPDGPAEMEVPTGSNQNGSPEVVELPAMTANDAGGSEGFTLTSDSESEIFCDSVDSVEQLSGTKVLLVTANGHTSPPVQNQHLHGHAEGRRVGAGQGGEGAEDRRGPGLSRRGRGSGQDGSHYGWRERGVSQSAMRRGGPGGGGGGQGGGDGFEGGAERQDTHLQQQIALALQRLRQDMRSVMERLEAVEKLATSQAHGAEWRTCVHCSNAASQQEESWWPLDVSPHTVLLFLLWPFVAQGLVHLLKKAHQRSRTSS